jgi:phospholipase C
VGTAASAGAATRPKEHDVVGLLTSGYLERLGFRYENATPARTFRLPSSLGMTP